MTAAAHAPSGATLGREARAEIAARVGEAAAHGTPLRIVGRGTWLDAGRPVAASERVEVGGLRGIVEYVPGDLTLTALAGTSLGEIAEITRREGQWLALDPVGGARGSLGAAIATASSGPLGHSAGLVRDNVLGVEFVTGSGETVRGGGRVVKNVAGFDLTRLVTGAWGTLGVITEATVRLRALPAMDLTVALAMPDEPARLAERLRALRAAPLAPLALELVSDALARRIGAGTGTLLLARLAGNDQLVRTQRLVLADLAELRELPTDVWTRLADAEPAGTPVVRLSGAVAGLAATWSLAVALARATSGWAQGATGRGVVRVVAPADPDALRAALEPVRRGGVTLVYERLPAALWPELAPSAANDRLSRGVRRAFDPHHLMNPGILGETA